MVRVVKASALLSVGQCGCSRAAPLREGKPFSGRSVRGGLCTEGFCLTLLTIKETKNTVLDFAYRQKWWNLHLICFARSCCFMYMVYPK